MLFCIPDGVSSFEMNLCANETARVIAYLRGLAYDNDTGAIFKLLVTSPRRSKVIASISEPETGLNVSSADMRRHSPERGMVLATRRTTLSQLLTSRSSFQGNFRHLEWQGSFERMTDSDTMSDTDMPI